MAVLGQPALGEYVKLEVTIKESYEFKVRSPIRTSVPSLELNSSRSRVRGQPGADQGSIGAQRLSAVRRAEHPGQNPEKDQPGPGSGGQQLEGAVPGGHHGRLR